MSKLLETWDANAVSPADPERRWDGVQSWLHQVCEWVNEVWVFTLHISVLSSDITAFFFFFFCCFNLFSSITARWLCYCHVPQSNDSLPRYETTQVFGRNLLKSIFTVTRRQLLEKFRVEKDKLLPEKRTLILTHFPKYGHSLTDWRLIIFTWLCVCMCVNVLESLPLCDAVLAWVRIN